MTSFPPSGTLLGRVWSPKVAGPCVVSIRAGRVLDITNREAPLVRDICEMDDPAGYVARAEGVDLGSAVGIAANEQTPALLHFLAPCDLHAVKACGVTFAGSMVERVIEEQATGDPAKAQDIRSRIG